MLNEQITEERLVNIVLISILIFAIFFKKTRRIK